MMGNCHTSGARLAQRLLQLNATKSLHTQNAPRTPHPTNNRTLAQFLLHPSTQIQGPMCLAIMCVHTIRTCQIFPALFRRKLGKRVLPMRVHLNGITLKSMRFQLKIMLHWFWVIVSAFRWLKQKISN